MKNSRYSHRSRNPTKLPAFRRNNIIITTGDVDGVGLEVTYKALKKINYSLWKKNLFFIYFRKDSQKIYSDKLKHEFNSVTIDEKNLDFNSIDFNSFSKKVEIVLILSSKTPADWVFSASKLCQMGAFHAMVTAPLSKTLIKKSGYKEIGHTEILQKISNKKNLYMLFIGKFFNVLLLTGHIPLARVPRHINNFKDKELTSSLLHLRKRLPPSQRSKPFALMGIDPHAGEEGIIGGQGEMHLCSFFEKNHLPFIGPLVPDAAFMKKNWKKFSVYLATYHDQGLIPFKMIHGQDSGVHITLGLPFIRTSVDHGTAKDIFGKNIANPNSMIDAISWAIKLL